MHIYDSSKNSLAFWFPIIKRLGLPVPETYIIPAPGFELVKIIDGCPIEKINGLQKLMDDIDYYANKVGYPCFLRTGHTSNKHDWSDTCFLKSKDDILKNIAGLVEYSAIADFSLDFFVIRKMMKPKNHFHAFNEMPITKEVRCFIEQDSTTVRRYWPDEAFREMDVKEKLDVMYNLTEEDKQFFNKMLPFLKKEFPLGWCFDFLQDGNGEWILIDMSISSMSYKNNEENAILIDFKEN